MLILNVVFIFNLEEIREVTLVYYLHTFVLF